MIEHTNGVEEREQLGLISNIDRKARDRFTILATKPFHRVVHLVFGRRGDDHGCTVTEGSSSDGKPDARGSADNDDFLSFEEFK